MMLKSSFAPTPISHVFLVVAFFLCYFVSPGQTDKTDSLQYVLKTAKEDTAKVNALNQLAMNFRSNNPDSSFYFASQALTLSEKLKFNKGISEAHLWMGTARFHIGKYNEAHNYLFKALQKPSDKKIKARIYNNIGLVYFKQSNYVEALKNYFVALKLREEAADKPGIAASYNNIGSVFYEQGNYSEALKNHLSALKMNENVGEKSGIALAYNNIGNAYYTLGNYPQALRNYFAALKLRIEIDDKQGIAASYNNIGAVYYSQGNYSESLKYFTASLKIAEEIGNKHGIAYSYGNIGGVYEKLGNYPEALKNHFSALKIKEEIGDKRGISTSYNNIGIVYYGQGNYSEALKNYFASLKIEEEIGDKPGIADSYSNIGNVYVTSNAEKGKIWFEKALKLSKEIGNMEIIKESYVGLSRADSILATSSRTPIQRKWEFALNALENYKMYVLYKDSLINEETIKKSEREKNQYEFDKKEAEAEAERQKKEAIAVTERKKQQIILWSVSGGLLLVALFAGFVFRSLRITKRQKQVIEEQKLQIVESINYSKKIQESLLPSIESIQTAIPDLFLFYEPKAIVSGDFYYFKEFESYNLLACVDCTGHGVPGGFMSTLGSLLLDKIVNDEALSPSDILNKLSNEIIRVLHQQDGGEIQDGMDLSVCLIDKKNKKVEFSGARNGIIIVSNNTAKRYKVSSLPVGGNYMKKGVPIARNFETQSATVNPGDWIYMYTDGFMEQRGGTEGIPMNFTQYESQLISLSTKQSQEEKNKFLRTELDNWRGLNERDDDVLIIGFQVI